MSSVDRRLSDYMFNLFAEDSVEPVILDNFMSSMSWPDICAAFSIDSVQALNLLFVPSMVPTEDNTAWLMFVLS